MKSMKTLLALAFCGAAFSVRAAVTPIPSGKTVTITDATVADYAGGIAFDDATGVVEFNTSAAPTMDITGAGTVKKTSSSDWTMSKTISNFTGNYILAGGGIVQVTSNTKGYFGSDTSATDGCLYIQDGNTLDVVNSGAWTVLENRRVHIAGTGKGSAGAIRTCYAYSTQSIVKYIICDADATFNLQGGFYVDAQGYLDVQEHTLTVIGKGTLRLTGSAAGQVRGSGAIVCARTNNTSPQLHLRDNYERLYAGSTTVLRFEQGSILNMQGSRDNSPVHDYDGAIEFTGSTASLNSSDQYNAASYCWANTNRYSISGPIKLGTDDVHTLLKVWSAYKALPITLRGNISGNGSLTTANTADYGRIQLMGDNTYTGSTFINNNSSHPGHFLAYKPTSLPNYSAVTCSYNNISVALNDGGTLWTPVKIAELANQATFLNGAWVGLDTTWATNTVEVALSDDLTLDSAYVGGVGPHDVEFAAPRTTPVNLEAAGGVTRVKGPGEFRVGGARVSQGVPTNKDSVLEFADGVKAITCDKPLLIGSSTQTGGARPIMRVANASLVNTNLDMSVYGSTERDAIIVGYACDGTLEIGEGAVVTNRILAGGTSYGVAGAVFQTGGTVAALQCVLGHNLGATANMGYYELAGGTFTAVGGMSVGASNLGHFYQTGGTAWMPSLGVASEYWSYGGVYSVHGGKTYLTGTLSMNGCGGRTGCPIGLTVEGAGSLFSATNAWAMLNNRSWVNILDGGVLELQGLRRSNSSKDELTVNFDGGIFRAMENGRDIFVYAAYTTDYYPTHVYVYNRGATIDTTVGDAKTVAPIESAGGQGVLSIPWTDTTTVRTFRPIVKIVGDGVGATAEAEYDRVNSVITGVRVLTQGTGYTQAKAYLMSSRNDALATVDCVIGAYESNGGFTKTGAKTFTLYATNTWKGATTVAGGTLMAGADWAIPTNTAVVLSGGGILDLNGKAAKISSVSYGAGGGKIINASGADVPSADAIAMSFADVLAGRFVELSGDVDLADFTLTLTGDIPALDENVKYPVVKVTDGHASGLPTIVSAPLPKGWIFRVNQTGVTIVKPKGLLMMVR